MNERKKEKESGESKCEVVEKGVGKKLPRNIYICNASKPILDWSFIFFCFFLFFEKARHLFYCCNIRDNLRWLGFIMRISERIKVNDNQQASLF